VHAGIACDVCAQLPMVGVRTFCVTCGDFDVCEACAAAGADHPPAHDMRRFAIPEATDAETGGAIADADFAVGQLPYGLRWEGPFKGGLPHGRGKKFFTNGDRYEGECAEGEMEGAGAYFYPDGTRYEGTFKDDKMEGAGTYFMPDGQRYEGAIRDGEFHGPGAMFWPNGNRYEGPFRDDKMEGAGTLFFADGRRWEGLFRNGERVEEEGKWFGAPSVDEGVDR
jgi:hypothetical protein